MSVLKLAIACSFLFASLSAMAGEPPKPLPDFSAKSLSGKDETKADLLGEPSILIVNPSEEAGNKSKAWAQEIRREFGPDVRQKTIIAVDVPFFVSEYMAMGKAQRSVPQQYWDRTWFMKNTDFEESIGIGSKSGDPHILVLDSKGRIVSRVQGELDASKLGQLSRAWTSLGSQRRAPAGQKTGPENQ